LHEQKKPIGAICIAPALLALAFKGKGLSLTVGETGDASAAIESLGHVHVVCKTQDCVVDDANRVVTTPAYMDDEASLHDLFHGIRKLVDEVIRLA
jgi:enhancing lycopene biosynthesis protein 2